MITHDLGVIAQVAQSVAVMYAGRIVEHAEVVEFFGRPKHPYTLGLMNSIPRLEGPPPADRMLQAIPGVVPNLLHLPEGCAFRERCSMVGEACGEGTPPMVEASPGHWVRCWLHG
jgi:oligopeptide/dipeptide ABC transporter ATP-binding protein